MKKYNFSPVVMLILGVVPFLLMIVQWVTEDIMGMGRVINYMTRWEVVFQIGIEMSLLGVILWCLDNLKSYFKGRNRQRNYVRRMMEIKEEPLYVQELRKQVHKEKNESFMREYLCQPSYKIDKESTRTQWSEDRTDNGTIILHRLPNYSNRACTLWPSDPYSRTNDETKF